MSIVTQPVPPQPVPPQSVPSQTPVYPVSDGLPMADNTKQFEYITTIKGGLEAQFRDDPNVFVAGDLFWYPVEGDPTIRTAPDTLIVFGRPKGHRGSYLQWLEDHIPPQVVFEIWSPGNRLGKMVRKFEFFQRYGVEEYYLFDPDSGELCGWLRKGDKLEEIPEMAGWVSPRLKVRFEVKDGEMNLYGPDGRKFDSYVELADRAKRLEAQLRALGINPNI